MTATIRDIAKAAGVSVATVSKVLNDYSTVSRATREKVLALVSEMQFRPNEAARSLVGRRSMTIGILLTSGLANPFFVHLLGGIDEALKERGYDLIYLAQLSAHPEYNFVHHCRSRNVEGVLAFGFQLGELDADKLVASGIPTLFIDLNLTGKRAGYISSDNKEAVQGTVRYLHELGHRRIACIAGLPGSYVGERRLAGYHEAMAELGLSPDPDCIVIGDFTQETGYRGMQRLLALPERPTAVVCGSDKAAIGALQAAREAGVAVPAELSIVGFDDIDEARVVYPPLTTVRQDMSTLGRRAVELLDGLIVEPDSPAPAVIVPTALAVRGTTGPPPRDG
ncbi:LacI family DNA-binding transcriptional regulator [Cohnella rhizosphaerae]|uniref:LacI family transcriptional regulator n=1 Tax=Cohnella rhizosphaerae TaxID=1457232 RepID=A0A9X4KQM7_9BACL|nr:LacI family DNA-binding transcriptional regulator [Cohnella rhizosphaerae]MDG0809030.1 LacI family transcriptional regulator [Cohnella rhizosphaerae]